MNTPEITLNCYNSINSTVLSSKFTYFSKCHLGQKNIAHSDLVQFNINRGADAGTIFVNTKNDGIAIATIDAGFKIINAWIEIEVSQITPISILSLINSKTEFKNFSNQVMYAIHQNIDDNQTGNISVRFYIEYEKI